MYYSKATGKQQLFFYYYIILENILQGQLLLFYK